MEEKLTEELKKEIEAQDQYDLPDVAEVEDDGMLKKLVVLILDKMVYPFALCLSLGY